MFGQLYESRHLLTKNCRTSMVIIGNTLTLENNLYYLLTTLTYKAKTIIQRLFS